MEGQMDNLRGLLGIRRMDSPEGMGRGVVRSDEGVLRCFDHMENDRIAKRVLCRREC